MRRRLSCRAYSFNVKNQLIIHVIAFYVYFFNKTTLIQGFNITILLFPARFSLIITTFATSELPQNSTKNKRGTTGYVQQLIIKELNIPRMFG